MAIDNPISVKLPLLEWNTELSSKDEAEGRKSFGRLQKSVAKAEQSRTEPSDLQFEPVLPHEVDSFA